jgi:peptidoglycan/LPS O-acetylase OafA/YrhL
MVASMQQSRPFFGRIESLRGIGCLAVAAYHMSGLPLHGTQLLPHESWAATGGIQNAIGKLLLALIPGHAALMMFFAISGCVLHVSLQYGPRDLAAAATRFAIARLFRIYPIVIFGTLVAVWALYMQAQLTGAAIAPVAGAGEIVANMLLLKASINSTLWALQVEVLMAPIILMLYFVERAWGTRTLVAIGLVTTALSFSTSWALWPPLSTNLFAFVLGMLIPTVGRQWVAGLSRRAANYALIGSVAVLFAAGPAFGFYSRFAAVFETYAALVLLSVVAFRVDVGGVSFLDLRAFRLLGVSSGSYYVLHMPLLPFLAIAAANVVPAAWSAAAPVVVGPVVILVSLAALVPVCVLSYWLVEANGIALGRRVLQSRRAVAAS